MRKVIFTLSISLLFCSIAMAQFTNSKRLFESSAAPANDRLISNAYANSLKSYNSNDRVVEAVICDYDAFDEAVAVNQSAAYSRFVWSINKYYPSIASNSFNVKWAAVAFDTIVDPNSGQGYSFNTTPYTLDSIFFYANHERAANSTTTDSLRVVLYEHVGSFGISINANNELVNPVIWDTILTTDTNWTQVNFLREFIIVPDAASLATINGALGQGTKFTMGIEFYGDTANKFNLWAGYADYCGESCIAEESVIPDNSFYDIILFSQGTDFSGVNPVAYNCDTTNPTGSLGSCEQFYIQNWSMAPALTIDAPFLADAQTNATIGCPGDVISLAANVSGAIGTPDIEWTGQGNIVSPYTDATDVVLPNTNGAISYYVRAIDNGGAVADTVYDTITINVRGINVDLGNDTTIACATTLNLAASVSGTTSGATFLWNDGTTGITYLNAAPGTYSITATNNSGCSATDTKVVSQPITQDASFEMITYLNADSTATAVSTVACEGIDVLFNNTSSSLTGWNFLWDYDNGNSNSSVSPTTRFSVSQVYTIVLTADSAGCVSKDSIDLTVLPSTHPNCVPVGINEADWLNGFVSIYPNPNAGSFVVDFSSINSDAVSINVFNVVGQSVYARNNFSVNNSAIENVDLSEMGNGFYFVRVQVGNDAFVTKVSVQK